MQSGLTTQEDTINGLLVTYKNMLAVNPHVINSVRVYPTGMWSEGILKVS